MVWCRMRDIKQFSISIIIFIVLGLNGCRYYELWFCKKARLFDDINCEDVASVLIGDLEYPHYSRAQWETYVKIASSNDVKRVFQTCANTRMKDDAFISPSGSLALLRFLGADGKTITVLSLSNSDGGFSAFKGEVREGRMEVYGKTQVGKNYNITRLIYEFLLKERPDIINKKRDYFQGIGLRYEDVLFGKGPHRIPVDSRPHQTKNYH